jgi:hypothetical protein
MLKYNVQHTVVKQRNNKSKHVLMELKMDTKEWLSESKKCVMDRLA